MKIIFKAFAKKLFGVKYERLVRSILLYVILFYALHSAEIRLNVTPVFLYLPSFVFTAGIMWQSLCSGDTSRYIMNMIMMPFSGREFVIAYVGSLGSYILITKTFAVWAILYAVGNFGITEIVISIIAAIFGIILATILYVLIRHFKDGAEFDAYLFYDDRIKANKAKTKSQARGFVWTYLSRYLLAHKNYLINTLFIWALACIMPTVLLSYKNVSESMNIFLAIGFGIVSINTPLTILVSCDHDLENGIKIMPGGFKRFFIPYGLFLFVNFSLSYAILLTSWELQIGGLGILHIIGAVCLAFLSAVGSILLEWFFPLKSWKIESDLWHHPRKYIVPAAVIMIAGLMSVL